MAEARSWIFQGKPEQYDLRSALGSLTELSWLVKRYSDQIHGGDLVYLWESGSRGGILAEARVLTEPAMLPERKDERVFWVDPEQFVQMAGPRLRVRLGVERVLERPLLRADIKENPELSELLILKFAAGTNFPVSPHQDAALRAMIDASLGGHQDAEALLRALVGVEIHTLTGAINLVLAVQRPDVVVRTHRSPDGQRVPIQAVQDAMDTLFAAGSVTITPSAVGYRSAFIGAVLLTLPGTRVVDSSPPAIELITAAGGASDAADEPGLGGAGQPEWTVDERILALDVYLRHGLAGERDPSVIELSELLRSLPIHDPTPTSPSFRNPHGVYWKLTCFAALDPNHAGGASDFSSGDQEVWRRFGHDRDAVARLASEIRGASNFPVLPDLSGTSPSDAALQSRAAGTIYVPANERAATSKIVPFEIDPNVVDRGRQGHARTQNALAAHIESLGYVPMSPPPGGPDYDLAWEDDTSTWVAEVKSVTASNEVSQLRLAIGQVLDYKDRLQRIQAAAVRAVVAVERRPSDARWVELCAQYGIILTWPDHFPEDICQRRDG